MPIFVCTTRTPRFWGPNFLESVAKRDIRKGERLVGYGHPTAFLGQNIDVLLWRNPKFWADRGDGIWAPEKIQKNLLDDGIWGAGN